MQRAREVIRSVSCSTCSACLHQAMAILVRTQGSSSERSLRCRCRSLGAMRSCLQRSWLQLWARSSICSRACQSTSRSRTRIQWSSTAHSPPSATRARALDATRSIRTAPRALSVEWTCCMRTWRSSAPARAWLRMSCIQQISWATCSALINLHYWARRVTKRRTVTIPLLHRGMIVRLPYPWSSGRLDMMANCVSRKQDLHSYLGQSAFFPVSAQTMDASVEILPHYS